MAGGLKEQPNFIIDSYFGNQKSIQLIHILRYSLKTTIFKIFIIHNFAKQSLALMRSVDFLNQSSKCQLSSA